MEADGAEDGVSVDVEALSAAEAAAGVEVAAAPPPPPPPHLIMSNYNVIRVRCTCT